MRLSVSFLSVLVISTTCVASDFSELTGKVPQGANAVMAIDVAKTLATPLAKTNGWDKKLSDGGADRPLYLPPEADKLLSAAQIDIARNFCKAEQRYVPAFTEVSSDIDLSCRQKLVCFGR